MRRIIPGPHRLIATVATAAMIATLGVNIINRAHPSSDDIAKF